MFSETEEEKQKEKVISEPEKISLVFVDMDEQEGEGWRRKPFMTFTSTNDGELFDLEVSEEEIRRIEEEEEVRRKKIWKTEDEVKKLGDEEERTNGWMDGKTRRKIRQKLLDEFERIKEERVYFCDK